MGVSVVIAAYNCEKYINECLNSLFNQSYKGKIEIIVCDDCSQDRTLDILEKYYRKGKIVLLKNDVNQGAAFSRNKCLKYATQEYVAILDADDYCHIDRLKMQVEYLENRPNIDFVSTGLQKVYDNYQKKEIYPSIEKPSRYDFLFGLPFMHATTLFRKDILDKVGGYRIARETRRGQDYDLFMRIYAEGGKGENMKEILYYYRCFLGANPKTKFKYRIDESIIRYKGFKAMKLGVKSIPYILKPLVLGFLPQRIIDKLPKH